MNFIYIAHGSEEREATSESLGHIISDNPLISILLLAAILLMIAVLIVWWLGRGQNDTIKKTKKVEEPKE
jgi:hypothetical protein